MAFLTRKKNLLLATAIAGICNSALATTSYDITGIGESSSVDIENGVIVKAVSNPDFSSNIVLIDGGNETVIAQNQNGAGSLNISGGIVYWTSGVFADGVLTRTLNAYDNGQISSVITTSNEIGGFSYDDEGNVAWVEFVNGGNEVFYYDGSTISQITTGHTNYTISDDERNIHTDNGNVIWRESSAVYLWDGVSSQQVSPVGQTISRFAALDGDKVVFIGLDEVANSQEVFAYESGGLAQLTSNGEVKTKVYAEDGLVAYQVDNRVSSSSILSSDLYKIDGSDITLLSETSVSVDIDGDKIVWTEGVTLDVNGELFVEENGEVTQIESSETVRFNYMLAEGGKISWAGTDETLVASPAADLTVINLGTEHTVTHNIDLNEAVVLEVSQWNNWSWTPNIIGFGFTSADGQELNGITVEGASGETYNLSGWWSSLNQPFFWEPVTITIPAHPGRVINVQWWAAAE